MNTSAILLFVLLGVGSAMLDKKSLRAPREEGKGRKARSSGGEVLQEAMADAGAPVEPEAEDAATIATRKKAEAKAKPGRHHTCPYGDRPDAYKPGSTNFDCHFHLPAQVPGEGASSFQWRNQGGAALLPHVKGRTCPRQQKKRFMLAAKYAAISHAEFISAAATFPLSPVFDKTEKVVGSEGFENMVRYHIDGLANEMNEEQMKQIEDKILLKQTAANAGVPTTRMYFGAHQKDFESGKVGKSEDNFRAVLDGLCTDGTKGFVIKPSHLAWSWGLKVVADWQKRCAENKQASIDELVEWVKTKILARSPDPVDAHLNKLEHGFTLEELFSTGGHALVPLEAKVTVVWGKVFQVLLFGEDPRGCRVGAGAWEVYGDGSGWDLSKTPLHGAFGMGSQPEDPISKVFMNKFFGKVKAVAERMATALKADYTRIDLFLSGFEEGEEAKVVLNEVESVSGGSFPYERQAIGSIWRDGYVANGRFEMSSGKNWDEANAIIQGLRDGLVLDPPPPEGVEED